jgi:RimJ/RimL family protein N-acetyltransferase
VHTPDPSTPQPEPPSTPSFHIIRVPPSASTSGSPSPLISSIAALVTSAAQRGEAVGLVPAVTAPEYRDRLHTLLAASTATPAPTADAALFAAVTDGTVIGTAQWTRSPYPTRRVLASLDCVVVAPESRRHGVAQALVDAAVSHAAACGIEVLMLEARGNNHAAIVLYERNGFHRAGVLHNAVALGLARHDVVLMARDLGRPHGADLLGDLPAGDGASLPRGVTQGRDWQRTDRLLLCVPTPTPQVADAYFAIHGDPATNVYNPAGPMRDPSAAVRILEAWHQHWREDGYGYWVVRAPETGRIIGFAGIRPPILEPPALAFAPTRAAVTSTPPEPPFLNLYYRFRPDTWGNGYATEVGRAALDLAAKVAPGIPVAALIRPDNTPSLRVAERLGLRLEREVERELGVYLKYSAVPEL